MLLKQVYYTVFSSLSHRDVKTFWDSYLPHQNYQNRQTRLKIKLKPLPQMALTYFWLPSQLQLQKTECSAFIVHNIINHDNVSRIFDRIKQIRALTLRLMPSYSLADQNSNFSHSNTADWRRINPRLILKLCIFFEESMKTVDKYQFNEELCTEDDGVPTFTAHHTILKRDFTLKMVSQGSTGEKDKYNYLIKQAQVLKKLIHPNIYKCHKLLRSTNNFYVIYDHVRGKTLDQVLTGNPPFQSKLIIIKQVIETLLLINHCKFAYLGLKPSNILVQEHFKILLKNFGNAQQFEDGAQVIDLVNFQGKIDTFMPPELKKGKVYPNSDFYSLGMLVGMMFEKEIQFGSKDPREEYRIVSEQYNINVALDLIFLKQLAHKLTNPNYFERSGFLELVKTRKGSASNNTEKRVNFLSSQKAATQHDIKSMKSIELTQIPQLQRSKSFKNILAEKRELPVQNLEELALFVIKERNFSLLLVNMSSACLKNRQAAISTMLILSFLLMKKATIAISQLAKLIKQGSNNDTNIPKKMMDYFKKTPAYEQFLVLTNQQMAHAHKAFQELISQIKNLPELQTNQLLQAELKFEKINNVFIKRTVLQFLLQLTLLPTQNYLQQYSATSLYYLYLLSLLSDYENYQQMYQQLFTEGIDGFENEPFIQELSQVDRKKVVQLIEYNTNVIFSEENYRSPLAVKNALTIK